MKFPPFGVLLERLLGHRKSDISRLSQAVRELPQMPRRDPYVPRKWFDPHKAGFGALVANMLYANRNLDWGNATKALAYCSNGRMYVSAVTVVVIGEGRVELTPDRLADLSTLIDMPAGDLAAITGIPLPDGSPPDPPAADAAALLWDVRRLSAEQLWHVCVRAEEMRYARPTMPSPGGFARPGPSGSLATHREARIRDEEQGRRRRERWVCSGRDGVVGIAAVCRWALLASAGMDDHLVRLPDEDVLVVPERWRGGLHPRRDGAPGPEITLDAGASKIVARSIEEAADQIERALSDLGTEAVLASAARAHLGGEPDPLGAAVLSLITAGESVWSRENQDYVDAWAYEHGVVFAACALTDRWGLEARASGPMRDGRRSKVIKPVEPGERGVRALPDGALRVRSMLAAATEEEYAEAVERLSERRGSARQRLLTAYLVPTQDDWVSDLCEHPDGVPREVLFRCLGSSAHLELLGHRATLTAADCYAPENLHALADGLGPAAVPLLAPALDEHLDSPRRRDALLEVLGRLPSDEAFRALLRRRSNMHVSGELMNAMKRFPLRAARELATEDDLLETHVRGNLDVIRSALPTLDEDVRGTVERIIAGLGETAEADPADLPGVLTDPPWARKREKPEPIVIKDLKAPDPTLVWADDEGEHERETRTPYGLPVPAGWSHEGKVPGPWDKRIADFGAGRLRSYEQVALLGYAPFEEVRRLVAGWYPPKENYGADREPERWVPRLAQRFGLDALTAVVKGARSRPGACGHVVVPFAAEPVAELVADWLLRVRAGRPHAEAWLNRHGPQAVRLLLPAAFDRPGKRRDAAEYALHSLARDLGRDTVIKLAREQRDEAGHAMEVLLERDPEELVPRKIPEVGPFADPAVLPRIRLASSGRALPVTVVPHLLTILAMSPPDDPDPGLDAVKKACDAESLAAFAWALFERWRQFGERSEDAWALTAVGWLGDDTAARRLAPVIRAWPGENGHHKAVKGLDVLAVIGTETSLMLLDGISHKAPFKAIKKRAGEKIQEVAARLGLTGEQLADRLVPGIGLDADGSMTLDYGPRRFVVGFDEQLKPFVTDETGRRRAALPKPGAKDDPDLAPAAYAAFTQFKKDVRATMPNQVRRLELAMTTGRRWTPREFRDLLVDHPLMWHIVRRLVWLAESGTAATAFRLAEDRTLADVDDEELTPSDTAQIGVAHPLTLGTALSAWSEVFADYEIIQPFPQLGREVHRLTDEETATARLARFEDRTAGWGKVVGLERRGWRRGTPMDNGTERWISRPVPGGLHVVIELDPGIQVGWGDSNDDQVLRTIWLADEPGDFLRWDTGSQHRFAELDEVTASEILADLESVTTP
ncbi:DUF4132 domain-containing protein [Spirillospora sp. CA-142024]|uniref:DUF4132 domain-containing protein n=1 Tax=Spirillospora sp. CA-142024 TaxID=3240036 RepID=UPI003D90C18D